jgi:hypothetical protein
MTTPLVGAYEMAIPKGYFLKISILNVIFE